MKNINHITYDILCSVSISIFFIPAIFLVDIISWKTDIWEFVYLFFMAAAYGLMFISKSKKDFFIKWGISLPLSYLILNYFWQTNYSVRSLNWVFPDYGEPSAGGAFAGGVLVIFFGVLCLISLIIAFDITKSKNLEKFQLCFGGLLDIVIIVICITLERQFPTYTSLLG